MLSNAHRLDAISPDSRHLMLAGCRFRKAAGDAQSLRQPGWAINSDCLWLHPAHEPDDIVHTVRTSFNPTELRYARDPLAGLLANECIFDYGVGIRSVTRRDINPKKP